MIFMTGSWRLQNVPSDDPFLLKFTKLDRIYTESIKYQLSRQQISDISSDFAFNNIHFNTFLILSTLLYITNE